MDIDADSLLDWLCNHHLSRSLELAKYVISEFQNAVHENGNVTRVEVGCGLTDNELDVGLIVNIALKMIYDKGYFVYPTLKYRILENNNETCILDQRWKYRFQIEISKRIHED